MSKTDSLQTLANFRAVEGFQLEDFSYERTVEQGGISVTKKFIATEHRMAAFRLAFPHGKVQTKTKKIVERNGRIVSVTAEARVYESKSDKKNEYLANAIATVECDDPANTIPLESWCHTVAKGKALLYAGIGMQYGYEYEAYDGMKPTEGTPIDFAPEPESKPTLLPASATLPGTKEPDKEEESKEEAKKSKRRSNEEICNDLAQQIEELNQLLPTAAPREVAVLQAKKEQCIKDLAKRKKVTQEVIEQEYQIIPTKQEEKTTEEPNAGTEQPEKASIERPMETLTKEQAMQTVCTYDKYKGKTFAEILQMVAVPERLLQWFATHPERLTTNEQAAIEVLVKELG